MINQQRLLNEFQQSAGHPPGKALCAKGSFFDPRKGGECWSCPLGTHRTVLYPVTGGKACEKRTSSSWSKATYRGKVTKSKPKGAFFDARKGGEWWKCPSNRPRRTAYSVTDRRACATKRLIGEKLSHAKYLGKVIAKKPKGAFLDPRKGGEFWSCPSRYKRTVFAVTAKNACEKVNPAQMTKATYAKKFGCGKGKFFDPRKGGQCWSCPSSWHRTVNPVTGQKACTDKLLDVFALDTGFVCKALVNALKAGKKEGQKFLKTVQSVTDPITKPINKAFNKITSQIKSPKELDKLVASLIKPIKKYSSVLEGLKTYETQLKKNRRKIENVLLSANLICGGSPSRVIKALIAAGAKPNIRFKKASLFDGLLIGSAHAAQKKPFYAFSVGMAMAPPRGVGPALAYTLVTDFKKSVFNYFSFGMTASLGGTAGITISAMIFPYSSVDDFKGMRSLGLSMAIGPGKMLDKLMEKLPPKLKKVLPAGFSISVDPKFNSVPGFGVDIVSFDAIDGEAKFVDVSVTFDNSWRLGR